MLEMGEKQKGEARSDDDADEQNEDVPPCRDLRQRNVSREIVVARRVLYCVLFEQVNVLSFAQACHEVRPLCCLPNVNSKPGSMFLRAANEFRLSVRRRARRRWRAPSSSIA